MTSQQTRRSNKNRRQSSTQAFEKAAVRLFVEQGYRSTSIDLIAREVGMTKGAVYFYFKDKETLLLGLLSKSEEHFFSQIFDAMDSQTDPRLQIEVFLDHMIRAGVEIDKHLLLLPVLISIEFKGKRDDVEQRTRELYDHVYDKLAKVIAAGQFSGSFSSSNKPQALAAMIVALTDGLLLEIYRGSSGVSGKALGQTARISVLALLQSGVTSTAK